MTNWFDDDPAPTPGAGDHPDDPWGAAQSDDPAVPPNPFLDPNDPLAGYPPAGAPANPYGNPPGTPAYPPAGAPNHDPYAPAAPADPYAAVPVADPYGTPTYNPYGTAPADPFQQTGAPNYDPYAPADPMVASTGGYDGSAATGVMPYADPYAPQPFDPYAPPQSDPFGVAMPPQSVAMNDPYASIPAAPQRAAKKSTKLPVLAVIFGVLMVVGGLAIFLNLPESDETVTPSTSLPAGSTAPAETTTPSTQVDLTIPDAVAEEFTLQYLSFTGARGTQAWVEQFTPYATPDLVGRITNSFGDWLAGDLGSQAGVATVKSVDEVAGRDELTFRVEAEIVRTEGSEREDDKRTLEIVMVRQGDNYLVDDVRE